MSSPFIVVLARRRERVVAYTLFGLRTALEAVRHNTLRAGLTSLGIMFGVASVIAMLAIGKGAEQEVLGQMRLLGSNNVVITPLVEQTEGAADAAEEPTRQVKRYSPGLSYADAQALPRVMDAIDAVTAEVVVNTSFTREGSRRSGKVVGVDTAYFRMLNLTLGQGRWFSAAQVEQGLPVAIIGHAVRARFFSTEPAVGGRIKVGEVWLTVVGVLEDRRVSGEVVQRLGIRDANMDVYIPVRTMLRRIRDRAQLTARDIELASRPQEGVLLAGADDAQETEEQRTERTNRNQLDRIIVRVEDSHLVPAVAEITQRMLARRHNDVIDFEVSVPELLLRQEQRARTIFNVVLGAIASISLVVGGIGIMNIMLASVLERIREIGVRRAVGATRRDIGLQFLGEAVLISLAGGIAGVLLGTAFSYGIQRVADIDTIISGMSVAVAFGVSVAVGIVFGLVPARRAAEQDPITSLRHE